ncbi:hypothetical protein ACQR5V_20105 [Xanthomonas oryzae pv. oryzicola]|uniref:hypothetical protein n=1 Tax=Xanthomonas oryzae TaxID=347 RepID=UPI0003F77752|nr:hypothetical protein [Xanthomonas oryzae]AJQ87833.1 hypothetical protein BE73_12775 [Xanthomonas oryzae pv. oryzicola]AKK64269.1 hypothetical protein FE36_10735 [Xanthomonas oryzae pv. oryzicola]AKO00643.1 hypothetical protein ACU15_09120 [Xanthomonas oryzae pv. oryzicola]AKO04394.1 hypothetical protein ACU16_09765 [Xanthomonas oryzae pv. oryzicola]AKO08282.1 hypothetical protein ACU17_09620 [Xanthomonas oryzae pv. oryzicola]
MSALWFLLGAATAVCIKAALGERETADRTRVFQSLREAQAWAEQMQDAGYTPSIRYEVRCYRRTKDSWASCR